MHKKDFENQTRKIYHTAIYYVSDKHYITQKWKKRTDIQMAIGALTLRGRSARSPSTTLPSAMTRPRSRCERLQKLSSLQRTNVMVSNLHTYFDSKHNVALSQIDKRIFWANDVSKIIILHINAKLNTSV